MRSVISASQPERKNPESRLYQQHRNGPTHLPHGRHQQHKRRPDRIDSLGATSARPLRLPRHLRFLKRPERFAQRQRLSGEAQQQRADADPAVAGS